MVMSGYLESDWRYCPRCAGPLAPSILKEGEPPRPACPSCGFVLYLNPRVAACTTRGRRVRMFVGATRSFGVQP